MATLPNVDLDAREREDRELDDLVQQFRDRAEERRLAESQTPSATPEDVELDRLVRAFSIPATIPSTPMPVVNTQIDELLNEVNAQLNRVVVANLVPTIETAYLSDLSVPNVHDYIGQQATPELLNAIRARNPLADVRMEGNRLVITARPVPAAGISYQNVNDFSGATTWIETPQAQPLNISGNVVVTTDNAGVAITGATPGDHWNISYDPPVPAPRFVPYPGDRPKKKKKKSLFDEFTTPYPDFNEEYKMPDSVCVDCTAQFVSYDGDTFHNHKLCIDCKDFWLPDKEQELLEFLDSNEDVKVVSPKKSKKENKYVTWDSAITEKDKFKEAYKQAQTVLRKYSRNGN